MSPIDLIRRNSEPIKKHTPVVLSIAALSGVLATAALGGWTGRSALANVESSITSLRAEGAAINQRIDAQIVLQTERYSALRDSQARVERTLDALSARINR